MNLFNTVQRYVHLNVRQVLSTRLSPMWVTRRNIMPSYFLWAILKLLRNIQAVSRWHSAAWRIRYWRWRSRTMNSLTRALQRSSTFRQWLWWQILADYLVSSVLEGFCNLLNLSWIIVIYLFLFFWKVCFLELAFCLWLRFWSLVSSFCMSLSHGNIQDYEEWVFNYCDHASRFDCNFFFNLIKLQ